MNIRKINESFNRILNGSLLGKTILKESDDRQQTLNKIKSLILSGDKDSFDLGFLFLSSQQDELGITEAEFLEQEFGNLLRFCNTVFNSDGLWYCFTIESIYLDGENINRIPPEIKYMTGLERLHLSSNGLRTLPTEIGNLTKLKWLSLGNNQLTTLPAEIGNLTQLQRLFLHNNQLTVLPPEIENLTELKVLFLDNNKLTSLPPEIGNLTRLERLGVANNKLTSLPPEIGSLTRLGILYLHNNQFSEKEKEKIRQLLPLNIKIEF